MTGTHGRPPSEPLTVELLADLHAGVFDEQTTAALRQRAATDAQASSVLAALDATVAQLSALPHQPAPQMPADVASRLDAALAREARRRDRALPQPEHSGQPGMARQPASPAASRPTPASEPLPAEVADVLARRRRRAGWVGVGALAAAAAAVGVMALSGVQWEITGTPRASDALGSATGIQSSQPLALSRSNVHDALDQALSRPDYGPLAPPQMLRDCLRANGVSGTGAPLGALPVTLGGTHGVLLALPTDQPRRVRLLVVGQDCGAGHPATMAQYVVRR